MSTGATPGTTRKASTNAATVRAGATTNASTRPPVRNRSGRGLPTGYQRRCRIGSGHSSGAPDSVTASPTECTTIPSVTAVPSQPAVPAVPPGTNSCTANVSPAAITSDGGPGTIASSPLIARARQTNSVPSSTGVPHCADAAFSPAPSATAPSTVWVRPRCVPRPVSRRARVSRYTSADSGRTT